MNRRSGIRCLRRWLLLALPALATVGGLAGFRLRTPAGPDSAQLARERERTPAGMVYVPGGWCVIGSNDPDADSDVKPARRVFVPSFYVDRTEVTNEQYRRFDGSHAFPAGEGNRPVTGVTYDQAAAYARWAGKRLPTEEEWEKAARGTDGRRYPWGNTWDPARVAARRNPGPPRTRAAAARSATCAIGPPRTSPVGSRPAGTSPYGCLDMAGNAWEWVQGYYRGNPGQRILRGGAVGYGERDCRTYTRAIEGSGAT